MVKHLKISGRVQGVGFRYYMNHEARKLGITGWVRNCQDGSVEAVVAGTPEAVEKIISWARRGPPAASVKHLEISDASGEFDRFDTLPID
jgi:acylphosphatase